MGNLKGWEWVIILLIVLLLFGASRLPALARSLGKSARIFRDEVKGDAAKGESAPPAGTDDDGAPRP